MEQSAMTAQTPAQRKQDERARKAMSGLMEVRGIYLPPELHAKLKELAKKLNKENGNG
jgi:hypothetical protein